MAYIRSYDTKQRKNGKPVKRYEVVWTEPVRDEWGLPIPLNPARPSGRKKTRDHQEPFSNREEAEARRDELNAARHTNNTSALAEARKAGDLPFGYYARGFLDSLQVKVAQGRLKQDTLDGYEKLLQRYALKTFGGKAVASITTRQAEQFLASLVRQQSRQGAPGVLDNTLSPATVKHAWSSFRRVMQYAMRHDAIPSNPADRVDFTTNHATGDRDEFEAHPLTATQVAELRAAIAGELVTTPSGAEVWLPKYPVYALMVDFLAYSGLRAAENTGLEVRDLVFTTAPTANGVAIRCMVHVRRTKKRKNKKWVSSTPKSKRSKRSVPIPPWLAVRMHAYLFGDATSPAQHPRASEPTAPLWPSRNNGGGYRRKGERYAVPFDWSQPMAMGSFYDTIFKPALVALGLPVSVPEVPATDTAPAIPATRGVRLHDLRHSFAVMQLMNGTHFMQVSKWLGHSTYTLTLDVYGDWVPEEDGGGLNSLPEPLAQAPALPDAVLSNVVPLCGQKSS